MLCNATGDPGCTNIEGWLSDATLYDWHGVNTDVDGKVPEIRNPGNNLAGDLEAELSNLANLTWLALRGNQLTGCIPAGLRDLRSNDMDELGLPDC